MVIEVLNHYVQLTKLWGNIETKKVVFTKTWTHEVPEFTIPNILDATTTLLKKVRHSDTYEIILSLDSSIATTMYSSVSLIRSHAKEEIDEADIDNLVSQAIWRFFDRNRVRVARKMNIDDVDVLLSDVRIRGVKLDGHRIMNPIGFKAKSVEIFFSQTFSVREFLRGLYAILPKHSITLMTETGTAISNVVHRALDPGQFFLANIFLNETTLFAASSERLAYHDSFEWGSNDVLSAVTGHLGVDQATAQIIIDTYMNGAMSEDFLRRFEGQVLDAFQGFAHGLTSLVDAERATIYINPFFTIPPVIFSGRFQNRIERPMRLLPLSTHMITEKLGFDVQFMKSAAVKNPVSVLAAFLEINFLPQNDTMSHLANRRVRWLVT